VRASARCRYALYVDDADIDKRGKMAILTLFITFFFFLRAKECGSVRDFSFSMPCHVILLMIATRLSLFMRALLDILMRYLLIDYAACGAFA